MRVLENLLLESQLDYIRALPEVASAYKILKAGQNSVYFTIQLPSSIKERLLEQFQLNLFNIEDIPCRWIQGDTAPHVDRGRGEFENTYLVYLTSGEGQFLLGDESYPIVAGTGFSFSEGLSHEVKETNGTARLLLGPMSEQGFAVGGVSIYGDGATDIAYIRDNSGTVEFKINDNEWQAVPFACYVGNSNPDPANNILKVIFTTDITLTSWYQNFWCSTDGIQFGSDTLGDNGSRPIIIVNDAPLYRGLFLNGVNGGGGYNNIYIYNLRVEATGTSTLDDGTYLGPGGWLCGAYFGNGATNNYIVNCSSDGPIGDFNGGIVGAYAGSASGSLVIRGCSSSATIGVSAGGIAGTYAGSDSGSITCDQCWSLGEITNNAGGIFGREAANGDISAGQAIATKCYSLGEISGTNAGGIFGQLAGTNASTTAEKCYSRGAISGIDAGGVYGNGAASDGGTTFAINCYSSGLLVTSGNGIYSGGVIGTRFATNCYVADGSWSSIDANFSLDGVPSPIVGTTWVSTGSEQPYELNGIGYTPYTFTNITTASDLNQSFSQTVAAGQTTSPAAIVNTDPSGNDFTILQVTGGDGGSYSTITMDSQTGAISTTSDTVSGTYTITLRSLGSYNITIYILLVTGGGGGGGETSVTTVACCQSETFTRDISYTWLNDYRIGRRLVAESSQNSNLRFYDYSEYVKYKMALGSGRI